MENLKQLDQDLFVYLNNLGTENWDWFWLIVTNEYLSFPIYMILAWLIFRKTGFKPSLVHGFMIIATVIVSYAISHAVKYTIMRPRPCDIGLQIRYLMDDTCVGKYGFYSTHASVGLALMLYIGMVLKEYYKYILWPLMIWVLLFCYSRIYVGKHFPGDIIVGLVAGFAIGFAMYYLRQWVQKKYKV